MKSDYSFDPLKAVIFFVVITLVPSVILGIFIGWLIWG